MKSKEKNKKRYAGIYQELVEIVGEDLISQIYERFHCLEF